LEKIITQYTSPQLETTMNGFATWLVRKIGGRLPAPRIRIVGAPEELWPRVHVTMQLTGSACSFEEWMIDSDAGSFPYFQLRNMQPARLDHDMKLELLPKLLPYYPEKIAQTFADYDAIIFLRLSRMPDPRRQAVVASTETSFISAMWTSTPIPLDDASAAAQLAEYLRVQKQT
jgi:hypothetical protein